MLALMFILGGFAKVTGASSVAQVLAAKGFPQAVALSYASGAVELIGGLLIVIGYKTRSVALVLLAFTAGTVLIAHNFWAFEGAAYGQQRIQALKNLGIMGGFLLLACFGPGRISVDRR
jgi:putative oxidoreductase